MSAIFLKTERLLLKEFSPEDLNLIFELDSDSRIMEFIRPAIAELQQAESGYNRIMSTRVIDSRFGNWVAVTQDTNEKIGWFCLKYIDETPIVEVGYRLLHRFWGNSYATEGAKALIAYGFKTCGLTEIAGITHPLNIRSQHVLEKCGLTFEKETFLYNTNVHFYTIKK